MSLIRNQIAKRILTMTLMVLVIFSSAPISISAALAVDVRANGENSLSISGDETFTISLTTTDATACQITNPSDAAISTNGSFSVAPADANYPSAGGSTTFTISCLDAGGASLSDSVTVSRAAASAPAPTIDVKANGSDGPVTLTNGETYTYTWVSTNATACTQESPDVSGVALAGSTGPIGPGHESYPSVGSSVTIEISCTNGTDTASDSVVINVVDGGSATTTAPTIDVKANGSDGPVTLNSGETYTYSWISGNATACEQTSPVISGITLAGSSATIGSGHDFYPSAGSSVTITIVCTNGVQNASDSVVINLAGGGASNNPTIDVKANGSDGPVTLTNGQTYTYTWVSANATSCEQTSPVTSGITLAGSSASIGPGHQFFYPAVGSSVTITVVCTNGSQNASDSVVINVVDGGSATTTAPTVDVKANGSDGPVTLNQGDTYVYTWVSANATSCTQTSPVESGITLAGSSASIGPGHQFFYPGVNSPVTITVVCTNGVQNATDSVVINLVDDDNGGGGDDDDDDNGGGGGGGRSRSRSTVDAEEVLVCPLIKDYMRIDFANDPVEVLKLQVFLRAYMGYSNVNLTGVFDEATRQAVGAFQMRYRDDILTPWGHTGPTYYVYILTLKKVNEIFCGNSIPLTAEQINEINTFRALYQSGQRQNLPQVGSSGGIMTKDGLVTKEGIIGSSGMSTTTITTVVPVVSTSTVAIEVPVDDDKGQMVAGLAGVLFNFPEGTRDKMQCVYEFALILIVLYILGSVLKDVFYTDNRENALKRFLAKWITIVIGLLAAIVISYALGEFCLITPLLLALILAAAWMATYKKHDVVRSSTKTWYTETKSKTFPGNKGSSVTTTEKMEEKRVI